jgi:hypothetical protein
MLIHVVCPEDIIEAVFARVALFVDILGYYATPVELLVYFHPSPMCDDANPAQLICWSLAICWPGAFYLNRTAAVCGNAGAAGSEHTMCSGGYAILGKTRCYNKDQDRGEDKWECDLAPVFLWSCHRNACYLPDVHYLPSAVCIFLREKSIDVGPMHKSNAM